MLLLLVGLLMILPETTIGHSVMSIFTGMVLVAAVWAAHLRSRLVHVVNVVVAIAVLGTIVALILHDDTSPLAFVVVMTLFTIAMPTTIIIALRDERTVNIQSVFGAISLYFMLGLLFAFLITAAEKFMDQPYFAQGTDGSLSQRVYFSFITARDGRLRRPHAGDRPGPDDVRVRVGARQPLPGDRGQPGGRAARQVADRRRAVDQHLTWSNASE